MRIANKLDEKGSNNLETRPTFVPSKHAKEALTFYPNAVGYTTTPTEALTLLIPYLKPRLLAFKYSLD